MIRTFRDQQNGDTFRIQIRRPWFSVQYELYCLSRPYCPYPTGTSAHLLAGDRICVKSGKEPRTLEQAKAIALHWARGFSIYARTGVFPNGRARVNVAES